MIKTLAAIVVSLILCVPAVCHAECVAPVSIKRKPVLVNGNIVSDVYYRDAGEYMLPVRAIAEALDCAVTWEGESGSVVISREDDSFTLRISGSGYVSSRGHFDLENPITLYNGLSFAPAGFFESAFGAKVLIAESGVNITTKKS